MKMKKLPAVILLSVVFLATLSCGKNDLPVVKPDPPVEDPKDPEPPTPTGPVVDYDKYQLKEVAAQVGLKLGVSFTYGEYKSSYVTPILQRDFAAVTFGNEMKQDAILQSSGRYDFSRADQMASWSKSLGNELFGHTLGWHSQQQISYLNTVINNAAPNNNASLVQQNWNFETGTLAGFVTDGFEIIESLYDVFAGKYAAKAVSDGATLQIDAALEAEKAYDFSFWARSIEGEGTVGIVSGDGQEAQARISSDWSKYTITLTMESAGQFACRLIVSKDVVIDNIRILENDGSSEDLDKGIDFESLSVGGAGQLTSSGLFVQVNGPNYVSVTNDRPHGGVLCLKMDNTVGVEKEWDIQVVTKSFPVTPGETYRISWYARASRAANFQIDIRGDGQTKYLNSFDKMGTDWTYQSVEYKVVEGSDLSIGFYGGVEAVTYYIDDIQIVSTSPASTPADPEVPAFKAGVNLRGELVNDAIGFVYRDWVYKMVEHFDVYGWDVVNETFYDWPVNFRNASNTTGDNVFVWGRFFPSTKDWVDKAFAYATDAMERYGKTAVLYLNDYNLETLEAKRKAFCDYVKGNPQVTGVGTQMHLDMSGITQDQIVASLNDLVATGKVVRISELDIKCTDEKAQADLYKFIFEKYLEIVPEAQRGGITIWGINDKDSWVGEKSMPLLYKGITYTRKPAYETLYIYLCERAGLNPYKD